MKMIQNDSKCFKNDQLYLCANWTVPLMEGLMDTAAEILSGLQQT